MITKREFYMIAERDEDGFFIREVPQLKACYSQGKTLDELIEQTIAILEETGWPMRGN